MKIRSFSFGCVTAVFVVSLFTSAYAWAKSAQDFVQEATVGNQFEISSSRLALQNSRDDDIKQFAQEMIDDHTQIGNQLKSVIAGSNAQLSQPNSSMDSKHQKLIDRLNKLTGDKFDKEYVKDQVKAHDQAVSLFSEYANSESDGSLKHFAAEMLPTLQEHQRYIDDLKASY